jgi:hypothetical protein
MKFEIIPHTREKYLAREDARSNMTSKLSKLTRSTRH